jgi:hypothetical protein
MFEKIIFASETIFDTLAIPATLLALAIAIDIITNSPKKSVATAILFLLIAVGWAGGLGIDLLAGNKLYFFEFSGVLFGATIFDVIFFKRIWKKKS